MTTSSSLTLKRLRLETLRAYGGKCACCGITYWRHLELDHINNDGAEERAQYGKRQSRGYGPSHGLYKALRDAGYPQGRHQVLCRNCNYAKRVQDSCPCATESRTVDDELAWMPPKQRPGYPGAGRPRSER